MNGRGWGNCGLWLICGLFLESFSNMPKAVDIYVLESKIGSGQFGDVFRGYSKVYGTDVAVKTIKRDKIKGTPLSTQASSPNSSKTRSKCSKAARTTTS